MLPVSDINRLSFIMAGCRSTPLDRSVYIQLPKTPYTVQLFHDKRRFPLLSHRYYTVRNLYQLFSRESHWHFGCRPAVVEQQPCKSARTLSCRVKQSSEICTCARIYRMARCKYENNNRSRCVRCCIWHNPQPVHKLPDCGTG